MTDTLFEAAIRTRYEPQEVGLPISSYPRLPEKVIIVSSREKAANVFEFDVITECRACGRISSAYGQEGEGDLLIMSTCSHAAPHLPKCGEKYPATVFAIRRNNVIVKRS